jgi:phosphatidylserine/phosphatidylglycerophosphate/cardiolipin synthase-like enzyme
MDKSQNAETGEKSEIGEGKTENKASQSFFCKKETEKFNFYIGNKTGGKLITSISEAKKSIKIASPFVSIKGVEMLREKYLGKMENITIITTATESLSNNTHREGLKKLIHREKTKDSYDYEYSAIFKLVIFKGNFFHAKFYIIDDEIVYVGSMNFTRKGMDKNIESNITFKDAEDVQEYINYFDKLFNANLCKWDIDDLGKKLYYK